MEAVGIGDLHFGKLDSLIPSAPSLIAKSIRRVFRYALDKGIKNVLFYGDVAERPRLSYDDQCAFYQVLLDPKYKDLEIHIILGNHDFAENGTHSLQVLELFANMMDRNVHVYTQAQRVTIDGVAFNFLPYPHTETTKNAINVGHFEVSGSLRDNGRKIEEGLSTKHVTLMGHLHTKHRVRNTFYSGTLYQTNFGEYEDKFFHHIKAGSHRPDDVEVIDVPFEPPWKLKNLTVTSNKDLKLIVPDENVLYKLFIKDGADIDIERVLGKRPNVVKHNVFKSKQDLETLIQQSWELDTDTVIDVVNVDDQAMVFEFMKASGLNKKQMARGMSILKGIQGQS